MTRSLSRREFVAATSLAVAGLPLWTRVGRASRSRSTLSSPETLAEAFPLGQVRLRPGPFLDAAHVNQRFLSALDPDRLLHMFRVTAGLPSSAEPLGGWEAPVNELRGHYVGHYLSACAMMGASLGDTALKARGITMVAELARCQKANGNGYLSAFPETLFDNLRDGKPAWAPFYTLHKIMAGLLDTYTLSGSTQALEVLRGMVSWTGRYVQPLGDAHMARLLEREYGGMNEVLYNLAAITGDEAHRDLAHRFDHERIFSPLAEGRDELKGLHVNTTIPKIIGAARRYEVTGESRARDVASYFWNEVTTRRCYCTGGTSNGESWNEAPGHLSSELSGYTQECCVTYNMLKLTRHVFGWTADPRAADYYERALFNGVLGTQHPRDGEKLYYVPLAAGYWKLFGTPLHDFWCCTGTASESFSKLGDSIYFHDVDGVYVNLFIASELDWADRGVRIVQETSFPESDEIHFTVHAQRPTKFALRVRVPYWATRGGRASLNGKAIEGFAAPSSYYVLDRTWKDGDRFSITLPMQLHVHAMPDDSAQQAFMYGPLVLVGKLGSAGLTPETLRAEPTKPRTVPEYKAEPVSAPALRAPAGDLSAWIRRSGGVSLVFQTSGQVTDVSLVPFYTLMDERYATYWKVQAPPG